MAKLGPLIAFFGDYKRTHTGYRYKHVKVKIELTIHLF